VGNAPERFDPLVRYAEFGWLPQKDTLTWWDTAISGDRYALNSSEYVPDPANGPGAALSAANVNLRARGQRCGRVLGRRARRPRQRHAEVVVRAGRLGGAVHREDPR
jgi:hypothetical protein